MNPMENFGGPAPVSPQNKNTYFESTASSKSFLAAKKFTERFLDTKKCELSLVDTPDNMEALKSYILDLGNKLMPGISAKEVIDELRNAGLIIPLPVEVKEKKVAAPQFIKTEYINIGKPKHAEVDEQTLQVLEANLLFEEIHKANIFKDDEELDVLHQKMLTLEERRPHEGNEYYAQFASLVKGGQEEIDRDLASLEERKQSFKEKEPASAKDKTKLEQAKKVATLTEGAISYGVSQLKWYGDKISIEPSSEFDDVKRSVDDVLEIRKDEDESSFMALGIDVTFRGLTSEQFKHKFFTLLESIRKNQKTKVKYFKNHKGEPMREFAIPKMVLYFNLEDVKELVEMIKESDNASLKEKFKASPQKFTVMNQIVNSCNKLAAFAEESQNDVFRKYVAVVNSIKELSWENPEIATMLQIQHDDKVSRRLDELIEEFKLQEKR